MLCKLAYRNARRSIKDYLVYLITITLSFSLIFAFSLAAESEAVAELSSGMDSFNQMLAFINIIIVFAVCFLINYTTKFMFEKRSREFGTYLLLGIRKGDIARLLVTENILLGFFAFILALPLGFIFSQFVSLVIVRLANVPEVIFISVNPAAAGQLACYFLVIYFLVLLNLLRRTKKMTIYDFLYLDRQNEKKMFRTSRKRTVTFVLSALTGTAALILWYSRCNMEMMNQQETLSYLIISILLLILSIYGLVAACADMFLSVLLKSKKLKYKNDYLFVARTFASKAQTMSLTFGTLATLILLAILCLNFSSINKGVYHTSIELTTPYDVFITDEREAFPEYIDLVEEDYAVNEILEYDIYREPANQVEKYYTGLYGYDTVMKLSDYNKLLKIRNMDTVSLQNDEYLLVTSSQEKHKVEDNENVRSIELSDGSVLKLKKIETASFWYSITYNGHFVIIVPDEKTAGLEVVDSHLVIDTVKDTNAALDEKICREMEHRLVKTDENGDKHEEYYRVSVRGQAVEEQNSLTAIVAGICLYIAFILVSAVGTILAVQSLSDSTKYRYRYLTLRRLGVNDRSLFRTIRKQLFLLFAVPAVYSILCSFCLLSSINNVYQIFLESEFTYLLYFAASLLIFFLIYGIYWTTTYISFKRNITGEGKM